MGCWAQEWALMKVFGLFNSESLGILGKFGVWVIRVAKLLRSG